ncbi:MAG: hypothetical protein UX54_C0030G0008 [Parcubacteria group bacterium GW2011_GWA2_46_39]|nr:MAG: hypothetical protein UX54_C0030G0008 [Parcubacteria group bacterium GW2011_GWA2_46_39]
MRLSPLQKFILRLCYSRQPKISRKGFIKFYEKQKKKPSKDDIVNIITKSMESLIDKELMVGFGERTSKKWYIKEVKLTAKGRRQAKKLLGEQQALPLKLKSKIKNQNAK